MFCAVDFAETLEYWMTKNFGRFIGMKAHNSKPFEGTNATMSFECNGNYHYSCESPQPWYLSLMSRSPSTQNEPANMGPVSSDLNSMPYYESSIEEPIRLHPASMEFLERSLKTAENMLDSSDQVKNDDNEILNPTPIGPNCFKVKGEVSPKDNEWHNDQALRNLLRQLLPTESTPMNTSSWSYKDLNVTRSKELNSIGQSWEELVLKAGTHRPSKDEMAALSCLRVQQSEKWNKHFQELVQYHHEHGNFLVPHGWNQNPRLAQWVKRQRYQYKIKKRGKHSTLTDEREAALNSLGFVWDSHGATWEERLEQLVAFKIQYGHCNVPITFPDNQALAVWVKCQRRQAKLYWEGKKSTMTAIRMKRLSRLGFVFKPREQQWDVGSV